MTLADPVELATPFFALMVMLEMFFARRSSSIRYETRDMTASLLMGFGNLIIGALLAGFIISTYQAIYTVRLFDLTHAWWMFLLAFFAEDFAYYWFHRISHERRWFWASHVVHHSSQHYNLSTALRQTWTGTLTFAFIFWLPLVWLGIPPEIVLFFSGISLVYQFWIHTEAIDRLGPLEWVLNTPSHHRVHHATNPRYLDANYAGVLIIWDRFFGSFVAECKEDPPEYGIIKRLGTFNPLRIAFHEWAEMVRDVRHAQNHREVFHYIFGAPGWSPDGSRKTAAQLKAEWRAEQISAQKTSST